MAKNIIDNSKVYVHFYYNNGKWVENPEHKFSGRPVDPRAMQFAQEFFHFLIESSCLNRATIMWLNSNLGSMRAMVDAYNNQVEEPDKLDTHNVESIIDHDKRKLRDYFDKSINVLEEVFAYPEKYLDKYSDILEKLQRKHMKDSQYMKALVVKIPKDSIAKEIDDRSWALLLQLLQMYNKRTIESINNGTHNLFTNEIFGYFNYLISSKKLNAQDKKRLEQINDILGIQSV